MLGTITFLILSISFGLVLKTYTKYSIESSITFSVFMMILPGYVLGLLNILYSSIIIMYMLGILSVGLNIYNAIKRKINIKKNLTPGVIAFIVLSLLGMIIYSEYKFIHWDECMHWGTNTKQMYYADALWGDERIDGVHIAYPPILGVIGYIFCKLNFAFKDSVCTISTFVFMLAILLPIFRGLKKEKEDYIKLVLFIVLTWAATKIYRFPITFHADLLFGILLGAGLFYATKYDDKEYFINLCFIMVIMVLLKNIGLFFNGIVFVELIILAFMKVVFKKESIDVKKIIKILLILIAISMLTYGSWGLYKKVHNTPFDLDHDYYGINEFNLGDFLRSLVLRSEDDFHNYVTFNFYKQTFLKGTITASTISNVGILLVIDLFIILVIKKKEDVRDLYTYISLLITNNIGYILYSVVLLITYLYAFTIREAARFAQYERYINTFMLAVTLASIFTFIKYKSKYVRNTLVVVAVILTGLYINAVVVEKSGNIADKYKVYDGYNTVYVNILYSEGMDVDAINEANYIKDNTNPDDRIYIINCENRNNSEFYQLLRYNLAPQKTNLMYQDNPLKDERISSPEDLSKILMSGRYKYVYIHYTNTSFWKTFGQLFENVNLDELRLWKWEKHLYEVVPREDGLGVTLKMLNVTTNN